MDLVNDPRIKVNGGGRLVDAGGDVGVVVVSDEGHVDSTIARELLGIFLEQLAELPSNVSYASLSFARGGRLKINTVFNAKTLTLNCQKISWQEMMFHL